MPRGVKLHTNSELIIILVNKTPNKPKKHDITDTDEFEDDHMVGEADQIR